MGPVNAEEEDVEEDEQKRKGEKWEKWWQLHSFCVTRVAILFQSPYPLTL